MGTTARENYRAKRGRKKHGPPFVQLYYYLLDSEAWHQLSFAARCAYVELARTYTGVNNGALKFSIRDLAAQLPCNKNTASRVLTELELAGFIEVMKVGTFKQKIGHASEYRLTTYRCDLSGELPSKKFNPGKRWTASDGPRAEKVGHPVPVAKTAAPTEAPSVPKNRT